MRPYLIQMGVWCASATDVQPRKRKTGCAWRDDREYFDASTRQRFRTPLDKGPVNGRPLFYASAAGIGKTDRPPGVVCRRRQISAGNSRRGSHPNIGGRWRDLGDTREREGATRIHNRGRSSGARVVADWVLSGLTNVAVNLSRVAHANERTSARTQELADIEQCAGERR